MLGMGLLIPMRNQSGGGGLVFLPEALALFAAMTTPPTTDRKILINATIAALIAGGSWTLMDILYVHAAADNQAARLNWKAPGTFTESPQNSPTFTADRGYTGDASSSYLKTGFTIGTNGSWAQNNNHMAVYDGTDAAANGMIDFGFTAGLVGGRSTATNAGRVRNANATSNDAGAGSVTTSIGHFLVSRNNSANYDAYKNGVSLGTVVQVSAAVTGFELFVCCFNSAGVPSAFSSRRISALHSGVAMNSSQATSTYNALNAYMTAVGGP